MICVSLAEKNVDICLNRLQSLEFAEIRMDLMNISRSEVKKIFSSHSRLIATCRPGQIREEDRLDLLSTAVISGAAYIDIELETREAARSALIETARKNSCQVIFSYHNYARTPGISALKETIRQCFAAGADIAKIACRTHRERDAARLLGLLNCRKPLVIIGMGESGRITRTAAPLLGAPFTFASYRSGSETAENQIDYRTLRKLIEELKYE